MKASKSGISFDSKRFEVNSSQIMSFRGPMEYQEKKVVVVGNSKVGKTTLIRHFVFGPNLHHHTRKIATTIGAEHYKKDVLIDMNPDEGEAMKGDMTINIWDTTGQEKFRSLAPLYYRDADACLFIFDLSRAETFHDIRDYWLSNVRDYGPINLLFAMVGTYLGTTNSFEDFEQLAKEVQSFAKNENIPIVKYVPLGNETS